VSLDDEGHLKNEPAARLSDEFCPKMAKPPVTANMTTKPAIMTTGARAKAPPIIINSPRSTVPAARNSERGAVSWACSSAG
jgi:hypothetical protein